MASHKPGSVLAAYYRMMAAEGEYPEQREQDILVVPASELANAEDWRELANRWADWALEEIAAGHAEMAGERARGAYRFSLQYQLSVGRCDA